MIGNCAFQQLQNNTQDFNHFCSHYYGILLFSVVCFTNDPTFVCRCQMLQPT